MFCRIRDSFLVLVRTVDLMLCTFSFYSCSSMLPFPLNFTVVCQHETINFLSLGVERVNIPMLPTVESFHGLHLFASVLLFSLLSGFFIAISSPSVSRSFHRPQQLAKPGSRCNMMQIFKTASKSHANAPAEDIAPCID